MAPPMVFGLQMSVCNLEFSIYYGHQLCCGPITPCPDVPEVLDTPACWLVHALPVLVPSAAGGTNTNVVGIPNHNFSLVKTLAGWPELIWTGQDSLIFDKVRATSFILLLGVGSFVCYRIFHHFKCRLENKRKYSTTCKKLHSRKRPSSNSYRYLTDDNSSDISSISDYSVLDNNSSSFDDRESNSDSQSIGDENDLAMGVSASHHPHPRPGDLGFEPVRYNKVSGVVFKKSEIINTPLKNVARNNNNNNDFASGFSPPPPTKRTFRSKLLSSTTSNGGLSNNWSKNSPMTAADKENMFTASGEVEFGDPFHFDETKFSQHDALSLKGNFSPGSLHERMLKAEEYWNLSQEQLVECPTNNTSSSSALQRPNSLQLNHPHYLKRQYSNESFSLHSDSRGDNNWPMTRTFSIDSQVSELAPELQPQAEELGCLAVERIQTLETELNDLKQTVLDLDAEFVQLKVYKKPPERCWELTAISLSDSQALSNDLDPELNKQPGIAGHSENNNRNNAAGVTSIFDVVQHHKTKMWYKGLLDSKNLKNDGKSEELMHDDDGNSPSPVNLIVHENKHYEVPIRWDLVSGRLLDWDFEGENTFDSGSDFGNSLETDSVENDATTSCSAAPISLEWDSDGIDHVDGVKVASSASYGIKSGMAAAGSGLSLLPKTKDITRPSDVSELQLPVQANPDKFSSSESSSLSGVLRSRFQKRKRARSRADTLFDSYSTLPKLNRTKSNSLLTDQIQRVIEANCTSEEQTPSGLDYSPYSRSELLTSSQPVSGSIRDERLVEEDESGFQERVVSSNGNGIEEIGVNRRVNKSNESADAMATKRRSYNNGYDLREDNNGNVDAFQSRDSTCMSRNNWDSAYCEGSDFPDSSPSGIVIGEPISVSAYVGSLSQNNLVKGYEAATTALNVNYLRRIRGDKSCLLRATLFQLLSQKRSVLQNYGGASLVYQALTSWSQTSCPWLLEWSFANKLPYAGENCLKGFWECLHTLQEMEDKLNSSEDPPSRLAEALNEDQELDIKLIEAVKLLMAASGLKLHEDLIEGRGDGSVLHMFTMLLFSRDVCEKPKDLVIGQLDQIGNETVLDQVGLYLLGHSLCASVEIVRPNLVDTPGFITPCPEWNRNIRPTVAIATEDELSYWLLTR